MSDGKSELPLVVTKATRNLRGALEAYKEQMTDEQRKFVLNWVFEDWCKLCGAPAPCYCGPGYDE